MQIPDFSAYQLEPVPDLKLPMPEGDFWVFGYGSLMWDPGFNYVDSRPAFLFGYHRRLCLWSIHYRGTSANPGLVLGLDAGGSCKGMGFKVSPRNKVEVCEYLKEREMLSNAYKPVVKPIYLENGEAVNWVPLERTDFWKRQNSTSQQNRDPRNVWLPSRQMIASTSFTREASG